MRNIELFSEVLRARRIASGAQFVQGCKKKTCFTYYKFVSHTLHMCILDLKPYSLTFIESFRWKLAGFLQNATRGVKIQPTSSSVGN